MRVILFHSAYIQHNESIRILIGYGRLPVRIRTHPFEERLH